MAANTPDTKTTLESARLVNEKEPNNILPDSRLEIINESRIEMDFVLKELKVSKLTERDAHFLVEFLLSPTTYYTRIDISQCNEIVIRQIIDMVLSRMDSDDGYIDTIRKMRLYDYSFPGSQFLTSLKILFEQPNITNMDALRKMFNELKKQIESTFQQDTFQVFSKELFSLSSKLLERFSNLNENPRKVLEDLTYVAIFLNEKLTSYDNTVKIDQYKLFGQLLEECFSIADKKIRYLALMLFRQELRNKDSHLFVFLGNAKKRFYIAALALSSFSKNKPEVIRHFSGSSLYREGVYNRVFVETLLWLALDKQISSQSKLRIVEHIILVTKKTADKTLPYKTWTLLLTLVKSNVSLKIEEYLKDPADKDLLENLFWKLLSDTLGLSHDSRGLYLKHFNHPLDHLFFGYRQNMIQQGPYGTWGHEEQSKFDSVLVAVIQKGPDEFRNIRYDESVNPHLQCVFQGENGKFVKSMWRKQFEPITLQEGFLNNCTLYCSDDFRDLFNWAIGINCLEPLGGNLCMAAHLLNGQYKVVLLKDPQGRVIGGYLFHLLLNNPYEPKPILAVGKAYIRDGYDLQQKRKIQDALDIMSKKIAEIMNQPLVAILTNNGDKEMHRSIDKEKKPTGIFTKPGYVDKDSDSGLDYNWYDYGHRNEVAGHKNVLYNYQIIFKPSIKFTDDKKYEPEHQVLTTIGGDKDDQAITNPSQVDILKESTLASGFKKSITTLNQRFTAINAERSLTVHSLSSGNVLLPKRKSFPIKWGHITVYPEHPLSVTRNIYLYKPYAK